jgi:membrane associated rhomboid family serine protease
MTQDHTTAAPVCYRHPDRHTLLRCSRCGRPICAACSIDASVGQRCPECIRQEGTQKVVPTGASRTRTSGAPATMTFIVLAVLFWLLSGLGGMRDVLYENLAQANFLVAEGEWWRIFTPVLLHAPGFMHILFNMWALWVLGPQIERGVGTWPFVGLYFASAGMGGAFMYLIGDSQAIAVGASGAIFGLFGVWLNWAVRRRNTAQGRFLLRQIGFLLLLNAALPFIIRGIAWEAHLGGLIAGFVIGELWSRVQRRDSDMARVAITLVVAALAAVMVLFL